MALVPAKTDFTIVPYGGAMDSRFPFGEPPPAAEFPARLVTIPELVFVAGYPEDEYLGYYMLEPSNLIDPDSVWWNTDGAAPQKVGGGNWAPANTTSIVGTLPTGVTYDATTTKLRYDGTFNSGESLGDRRKTVSLKLGTLTQSFVVRVVVPNVIWGDATQWDAGLPSLYKTGGALESTPKIAAHVPLVYSQSFEYACKTYWSTGTDADSAGIILVTRGTYDQNTEGLLTGDDIEWFTKASVKYGMLLGEPVSRPVFTVGDGTEAKFGLGMHDSGGTNLHVKNCRFVHTSGWISADLSQASAAEICATVRKTEWTDTDGGQSGNVLGAYMPVVDGTSLSSGTRAQPKPTTAKPWKLFVELSEFIRSGASGGIITTAGGWHGQTQVNGCRFLGSFTGGAEALVTSARFVRTYNNYVSYLPDPATVGTANRLKTFCVARASSTLDAWNCRALLGQHSTDSSTARPRRLFHFTRTTTAFSTRYPPYYPDVAAQSAPFSPITVRFTASGISTAGAVPQLSYQGGAFADAGSAALESGSTWNCTFDSTDFPANGEYQVRLRNSASTLYTSSRDYLNLRSYQNATYWLVNSNVDQALTDGDYPAVTQGPAAYAPDTTFWSGVDRTTGLDARTNKRYIAHCSVQWDARPNGAAAAVASSAVIVDEGSYPIDDTSNLYGRVPAGWTDLGVTFVANSEFTGFSGAVWSSSNPSKGSWSEYGVGGVPAPLPVPLINDYQASNVIPGRAGVTVDLPNWWGSV